MIKNFDIPPVWALILALIAWGLSYAIPLYEFNVSFWLIGVLVGAGVYLVVWSAIWFWRSKTTIEPRKKPKKLVVQGPYRINRNPIYTGMTAILFAIALYLGTISAFLPVIMYPIIIFYRFIRKEEETIKEEFGEEADKYFKRTRRW